MAVDIAKMAEEEGTRKVFLGNGPRDTYLAFGRHWGPGQVEVPNSIADVLVEAVKRVSRSRRPEEAVNPEGPPTPKPVQLDKASDEELIAALVARGLQPPGAPAGPQGDGSPSLEPSQPQGGGEPGPNGLSGLQQAQQAAEDAAAKVQGQQPPSLPPLTPPTILAPKKPEEGA